MKAILLAGGKGTRLSKFTHLIPKPMVEIDQKPILQYQIELLRKYQMTEIIILVNYLKEHIINYFGDGKKFGVSIRYFEEPKPLGTVGGIKEIEEQLTGDFLVLYGDIMINMDLNRFIAFHKEKNSDATIAVHPNDHPYDSDLVETNKDDKVIAFHAKPHSEKQYFRNLVNAGAYIFSPNVLQYIEKGKKADFGRDIFPVIFSKIKMYAYNTAEYLKDMGTPKRLEEVSFDIKTGKVAAKSYEKKQKAVFLDRDGVLNIDKHLIHKPEDLELYPFAAQAVKRINNAGYLAIVVSNQSVVARNLCTINELEYIHKKLETLLGFEGAKLDRIYYCPHHPDKGFPEENPAFKIECPCRKPKSGMIYQAARDFNINLAESYLIGDSERDIIAGKNAGCKTIGVMTGKGVKKATVLPDYFFHDLGEAARFITTPMYQTDFERILSVYSKNPSKPFVILVGGIPRSGKSNFTTFISHKFREKECKTLTISLDKWILSANERQHCKTVYDRFQLQKIEHDIRQLFKGKTISAKGYAHHSQRDPNPVQYRLGENEVVLIEGVVALSSEVLRRIADIKLFISIDEATHKQRFWQFYQWRDYDEAAIRQLYEERKRDEFDLIKREHGFADMIIKGKSILEL